MHRSVEQWVIGEIFNKKLIDIRQQGGAWVWGVGIIAFGPRILLGLVFVRGIVCPRWAKKMAWGRAAKSCMLKYVQEVTLG